MDEWGYNYLIMVFLTFIVLRINVECAHCAAVTKYTTPSVRYLVEWDGKAIQPSFPLLSKTQKAQ